MKIQQFVGSLLPSLAKEDILDDIQNTRKELKEITIPAYNSVLALMKSWKFKAPRVQDRADTYGQMVKKGNVIVLIAAALPDVAKNLDVVEKMIDATFNEDAAAQGLTFLKAQTIQFVEMASFVSKFARKFLDYVLVFETQAVGESAADQQQFEVTLSPREIQYIENNFLNFCTAIQVTSGMNGDVKKALDDIPEIVITDTNVDTLQHTVGDKKLDPLQMRLIPVWLNPIYHIGLMIAEWQANRYKAAKAELKLVELRKLNLEKLSQGKPDAHLQKMISYEEGRAQDLNYEIAEMERKYA